jgi:hypothetical protein
VLAHIELTGEDLSRNLLFVGTVGSGKTSTMNPLLHGLIGYRAADRQRRLGLLIIDFKEDETVAKVQQWAREAGREGDLQVLSPGSEFYYDSLAGLESFSGLDEAVDKILSAAPWEDSENGYWRQGRKPLLDAALTILLATTPALDFAEVMRFLRGWLMNPGSPPPQVAKRLSRFQEVVPQVETQATEAERDKLRCALDTIRMWAGLDSRTKSNWTSVFTNCLSPFTSLVAQAYFDSKGRRRVDLDQIVTDGKLVVLSLNASTDPAAASLIGRLIKADFYRAVQSRQIPYADTGRLVGLVMDEYPLVVTGAEGRYGDIVQLQSLRSKRGFVMAAAQGFVNLEMVIGARAREALLVNFNNLFFFNSHEPQIDAFAQGHFGLAPLSAAALLEAEDSGPEGSIATERRWHRFRVRAEDWVCPPGRLSRLEPNQAFVSLAQGRIFLEPVWFEPEYYSSPIGDRAAAAAAPNVVDALRRLHRESLQKRPWGYSGQAGVPEPCGFPSAPEPPESAEEPPESGTLSGVPAGSPPPASEEQGPWEAGCVITLSSDEYAALCEKPGLVARFLENSPEAESSLLIPKRTSPDAEEVELFIPATCLKPLLDEKELTDLEKHFKELLHEFISRRHGQQ